MEQGSPDPNVRLDEIATEWNIVYNPAQFIRQYAPAVERYFRALIKNPHDAEDVAQDFFMRVTRHGFARARKERGRFRDYLKAAVRNSALNFLRRQQTAKKNAELANSRVVLMSKKRLAAAEQEWMAVWRRCVLDRACQALERHQRGSPGNLFSTVVSLLLDFPDEDAKSMAERTSAAIGKPIRVEAFRKQVSRARRKLARLLVQEIAKTLDAPTAEQVKDELIELSLWQFVRDYLPDDPSSWGLTA